MKSYEIMEKPLPISEVYGVVVAEFRLGCNGSSYIGNGTLRRIGGIYQQEGYDSRNVNQGGNVE